MPATAETESINVEVQFGSGVITCPPDGEENQFSDPTFVTTELRLKHRR